MTSYIAPNMFPPGIVWGQEGGCSSLHTKRSPPLSLCSYDQRGGAQVAMHMGHEADALILPPEVTLTGAKLGRREMPQTPIARLEMEPNYHGNHAGERKYALLKHDSKLPFPVSYFSNFVFSVVYGTGFLVPLAHDNDILKNNPFCLDQSTMLGRSAWSKAQSLLRDLRALLYKQDDESNQVLILRALVPECLVEGIVNQHTNTVHFVRELLHTDMTELLTMAGAGAISSGERRKAPRTYDTEDTPDGFQHMSNLEAFMAEMLRFVREVMASGTSLMVAGELPEACIIRRVAFFFCLHRMLVLSEGGRLMCEWSPFKHTHTRQKGASEPPSRLGPVQASALSAAEAVAQRLHRR